MKDIRTVLAQKTAELERLKEEVEALKKEAEAEALPPLEGAPPQDGLKKAWP